MTESLGVPRVYIKLLVELEDYLNKSLADKVGFVPAPSHKARKIPAVDM